MYFESTVKKSEVDIKLSIIACVILLLLQIWKKVRILIYFKIITSVDQCP